MTEMETAPMTGPRISPDELLCIYALGASTAVAVLSLVLAACAGYWGAAEASLVAVVVLLAETVHFGRGLLGRTTRVPSLNSTKALREDIER